MWIKVKGLVEYLQDSGVRVDGIGWQGHIDTGFEKHPDNVEQLRSLIRWAHARKLEFHVTEFNAWIRKGKDEAVLQQDLVAQADTYMAALNILKEHSNTGVVTWCAWQIKGNETKRGHLQGNLFNSEGKEKPAMAALRKFVQQQ